MPPFGKIPRPPLQNPPPLVALPALVSECAGALVLSVTPYSCNVGKCKLILIFAYRPLLSTLRSGRDSATRVCFFCRNPYGFPFELERGTRERASLFTHVPLTKVAKPLWGRLVTRMFLLIAAFGQFGGNGSQCSEYPIMSFVGTGGDKKRIVRLYW